MSSLTKFFKETDIKFRAAALFAIAALLISLITGLVSGVGMSIVLVRVLLSLVIFAAIGYFSCSALQRYAPEFFDIFRSGAELNEGYNVKPEASSFDEDDESERILDGLPAAGSSAGAGFTEFDESSFPKVNLSGGGLAGSPVNLGKHKVAGDSEYEFDYQPELMAEAVRTMMKKDGD